MFLRGIAANRIRYIVSSDEGLQSSLLSEWTAGGTLAALLYTAAPFGAASAASVPPAVKSSQTKSEEISSANISQLR